MAGGAQQDGGCGLQRTGEGGGGGEGKLAEMRREGNRPGGGRVSGWRKEWTNLHALFSPGLRCDLDAVDWSE